MGSTQNGRSSQAKRLLKTAQAAEYLSLSPWALRHLVATGKLPVVQVTEGAKYLFDIRDLDGFVERSKITRDEP